MNILVVDDSGTMRTIIRRAIESLQIGQIFEACDGQEALHFFEQGCFDLVLSDWNMPNMDGFQLLQEIRKRAPKIPVLMITTEAERSQVLKAIQHGVSDYLVKPFDRQTLGEKLLKWRSCQTASSK